MSDYSTDGDVIVMELKIINLLNYFLEQIGAPKKN